MQATVAAWLMATLTPSALMVALVQTASTAPSLLFGLLSGSLADMVHHMLTERDVSQTELARLEQLIADRKAQRSRGRHVR